MEIVNTDDLKKEVETEFKPENCEVVEVKKQAQQNAIEIVNLDLEKIDEKRRIIKSIDEFAMDTLKNSARKNSLLQTTVGNLSKGGEDNSVVSNSLADLHREIKDLDPSCFDFNK
jgi:hypothetical protein